MGNRPEYYEITARNAAGDALFIGEESTDAYDFRVYGTYTRKNFTRLRTMRPRASSYRGALRLLSRNAISTGTPPPSFTDSGTRAATCGSSSARQTEA